MPVSFVQYWQLKQQGLVERQIRGNIDRRPDESWPLPDIVKNRMRMFLQGLGFDPVREIFVRDLPPQKCFHLTQRAAPRPDQVEKRELRWHERSV